MVAGWNHMAEEWGLFQISALQTLLSKDCSATLIVELAIKEI